MKDDYPTCRTCGKQNHWRQMLYVLKRWYCNASCQRSDPKWNPKN